MFSTASLSVLTTSLNPRFLLYPVPQFGHTRVDTGFVPASAALAPAHDAGLEPLSRLLETHQGASGVSLVSTIRGDGHYIRFGCESAGVAICTWPFDGSLSSCSAHVARSHLARIDASGQESTAEHPGRDLALRDHVTHGVVDDLHLCFLQQPCYATCQGMRKGVSAVSRDLCVHREHQKR